MDLHGAQWMPAEQEHFEEARWWRNESRAGLRTPMMLSRGQQRAFADSLSDRGAPHRYWALASVVGQGGNRTLALAGLTGIEWENGLAEMSLITPSTTTAEIEGAAVDFLLAEAFDWMRLLTVTVEAYESDPERVAFWRSHWTRYVNSSTASAEAQILPRRKWWAGRLWSSLYFTFTAEGYRLRQAKATA